MTAVRKGQAPDLMAREEFGRRFRERFYDPAYRPHDGAIAALEDIAWDAYAKGRKAPITEKAVPGLDEDVITMSIEAARNALARAEVDPSEIRAVWVGSESHPYAVKPTSTVVAEAIGAAGESRRSLAFLPCQ